MELSAIIILIVVVVVGYLAWKDTSEACYLRRRFQNHRLRKMQITMVLFLRQKLNKLTKVQLIDLAEKKSLKVKKSGSKAVVNQIWSQMR